MNCLPKPKCFKVLRRILSRMFPTSRPLWQSDDKKNVPLDFEISSHFLSNSSLSSQSLFNIWKNPEPLKSEVNNNTYAVPKTYLNSSFDCSDNISPSSSGYVSCGLNFSPPYVFNDTSNTLCQTVFNSSYIPYSPLSTFSSEMCSGVDNSSIDEKTLVDEIRREFESNGTTVDMNPFFKPPVSSTPLASRRNLDRSPLRELSHHQNQEILYPPMPWKLPQHGFPRERKTKRKFKPNKKSLEDHCVFCKNNGAEERVYKSHTVKDAMGKVLCPTLRLYRCPICRADGDKSHTIKYCPKKKIITPEDLQRMEQKKNQRYPF